MASTELPIALQLFTVRQAMEKDAAATLKQVAEMGYTHVELAGLYGHTPEQLKQKLDAAELQVIASHDGIVEIDEAPDAVADRAKTLGYEYIVCPGLPEHAQTSSGYHQAKEVLTRFAGDIAEDGLYVGYHNHAFEWDLLDTGERGIDILFDEASGQALRAELDTGWIAKAGDDPTDWMQRLTGRIPLLHLKDMKEDGGFCELGAGTMPLEQICDQAPVAGCKALIIEQDDSWIDNDPLKSAKQSIDALKKILGRS